MASWYSGGIPSIGGSRKSKVGVSCAPMNNNGNDVIMFNGEEDGGELTCDEHEATVLDMYCRKHDEVLCGACVAQNHRMCSGVVPISELKTFNVKKKEFKQSAKDLNDAKQRLLKIKQSKREELKLIESDKIQALKDIDEFRDLIKWALDRLERKGKEYAEKRHKELSGQAKEDIENCDGIIEAIDRRIKRMSKVDGDSESTKAFVEVKKRREIVKKAGRVAEVAKSNSTKACVKFTIDPKVEKFARSLSWYGKDRTYLSFEPPITFPHSYTVKSDGQFDIRVKGDRHVCAAVGACQLPNGTLLVADASNRRLKQLDVLYQLVDHLDLPAEPTAVGVIDSEHAVVALSAGADALLQFVDVKNHKLELGHSVRMLEKCVGLGCSDDDTLYLATSNSVSVYSINKETLQTIYSTSGGVIHSLTLNFDKTKIHLMESSKGLVTIDLNGEEYGATNDSTFGGKLSVAADENGQIFTSGQDSHVVTQFNHDHSNLGVLLTVANGIKGPLAIAYDRLHNRLVVTINAKNVIKVFDLK